MQPDSPYQLIEALGSSEVGTVWSAVDQVGRPVTVVVLDVRVATDDRWRQAFATAVNALAHPQAGGPHFFFADFSAAAPWAAFAADSGPGAERVFLALGVEYHPVPPDLHDGASSLADMAEVTQAQPVATATAPAVPAENPPPAEDPAPGGNPASGTAHGKETAPAEHPSAAEDAETTQVMRRIDPWAAGPPQQVSPSPQPAPPPSQTFSVPAQPVSPPHPVSPSPQPVSPVAQPFPVPPQRPISVPPLSTSGPPWSVSGPPQPTSGQPYPVSGAPHPYPVSGAPTSWPPGPMPPAGPLPPAGPFSYEPTYPDGPRIAPSPPPPSRRRTGRLLAIVAAIVVLAGTAIAWQAWPEGGTPESQPTSTPPSTPVLSSPPIRPGLEPPGPGSWPADWPQFDQASRVQTLALDGLGFELTVPSTWDCVPDSSAQGFVKYNCGTTHADGGEIGGELIVRDCPKPCDEARRTTMRQAEEAWGQQWRYGGEYATLAETLNLNDEQRYGLVVVAYRRSVPGGTVDQQLVLRMAAPTDWVDEVRRVANGVRKAAAF